MKPSTERKRVLGSALRAFVAQARYGDIKSDIWIAFEQDVASAARDEDDQILQSSLSALEKHQKCVTSDHWRDFTKSFENKLIEQERLELLEFFSSKILGRQKPEQNTVSRKRAPPEHANSSQPEKKRRMPSSSQWKPANSNTTNSPKPVTSYPGFYLLKTPEVNNAEYEIALEDIIVAGAELAVVCNFKFDVPWMWERAPALQTCRKVLIVHGEPPEVEQEWNVFFQQDGAAERVRFMRPTTPPYGTVHTKMFILFYASGCRVCVHTANMVKDDWDYKTQGAYLRDFPVKSAGSSVSLGHGDSNDFKLQLTRYFQRALSRPHADEVVGQIERYDFSSAGVSFVASVPGSHKGREKEHFGHARLRKLLSKHVLETPRSDSAAVCQFSSLGSIQQKWLEEEFSATLFASCNADTSATASRDIQLVFPTLEQVQGSNEGLQAGASLPVQPKNLNRAHITSKLHKWDATPSGRSRAMPHIKTFLRYETATPTTPLWVFLGSFNLSGAAWGRMQGARKQQAWDRLAILSYEAGVLFTPRLACPAKYILGCTIKYDLPSKQDEEIWAEARRSHGITLRICEPLASQNRSMSQESPSLQVDLPLPYKTPPLPYGRQDTAWNTSYCAMA